MWLGRLFHSMASLAMAVEGAAWHVARELQTMQSGFGVSEIGDFVQLFSDPGEGEDSTARTFRDDDPDCLHLVLLNEIQIEDQG
jgi:hypothetical protein